MAKTDAEGASEKKEPAGKRKKTFKKRGEKRIVHHGLAHIHASFNNTTVTITDTEGNVVAWSSAGGIGFKGSRKGTPYAATQAALNAGNVAKTVGMRSLDVRVKGPGSGREANDPGASSGSPVTWKGRSAATHRRTSPSRRRRPTRCHSPSRTPWLWRCSAID